MKRIIIQFCALVVLTAFLSGCSAYKIAVDERNVSTAAKDEKISFMIKKEFLNDDQVKYFDYDALSYDGHVFIIGEYDSKAQADKAIALAKKVEGVKRVTTFLLPKKEDDLCGSVDNMDLFRQIKTKLVEDENIWSTNVNVTMLQCNAVLTGIVGSANEKARAEAHARSVRGVRSVKSYLKVK